MSSSTQKLINNLAFHAVPYVDESGQDTFEGTKWVVVKAVKDNEHLDYSTSPNKNVHSGDSCKFGSVMPLLNHTHLQSEEVHTATEVAEQVEGRINERLAAEGFTAQRHVPGTLAPTYCFEEDLSTACYIRCPTMDETSVQQASETAAGMLEELSKHSEAEKPKGSSVSKIQATRSGGESIEKKTPSMEIG